MDTQKSNFLSKCISKTMGITLMIVVYIVADALIATIVSSLFFNMIFSALFVGMGKSDFALMLFMTLIAVEVVILLFIIIKECIKLFLRKRNETNGIK